MNISAQTTIPQQTADTRLHLYLASACPFCHRVLAALAITGLADHVTYTWMRNIKGAEGWEIEPGDEPAFDERFLSDVYARLDSGDDHSPSVPLLVDLSTKSLLSTSSPEITRYFTTGMNGAREIVHDLCPTDLVEEIDAFNESLHQNINRAVYLVGFAMEQADYEAKVADLFAALDEMEQRLSDQPFLFGNDLSESDLYLFATLVRFDSVYHPLFKCSYRLIGDYPALSAYLERMESIPALRETVDRQSYKEHYFLSVMHVRGEVLDLNPTKIVPVDRY